MLKLVPIQPSNPTLPNLQIWKLNLENVLFISDSKAYFGLCQYATSSGVEYYVRPIFLIISQYAPLARSQWRGLASRHRHNCSSPAPRARLKEGNGGSFPHTDALSRWGHPPGRGNSRQQVQGIFHGLNHSFLSQWSARIAPLRLQSTRGRSSRSAINSGSMVALGLAWTSQ